MVPDVRRSLVLALSLVLVANPLVLAPNATEPSDTYRAAPVEITESGIELPPSLRGERFRLPDVACQMSNPSDDDYGRFACVLDLRALERGSVNLSTGRRVQSNLDGDPGTSIRSGPRFESRHRYTRIDGQFYRRRFDGSSGRYWLVPVTPERAMENVSVPYQRATLGEPAGPDPEDYRQRVIRRGRLTVHDDVLSEAFVRRTTDDGATYYLVWHSDSDGPLVTRPLARRLLPVGRAVLVLLGVGLLARELRE